MSSKNVTSIRYTSNPALEYTFGKVTDLFDQHQITENSEKIYVHALADSDFDTNRCVEQIMEFKRIISNKFKIEKPLNFYAIIRTATNKAKVLDGLNQQPNFFKDKNVSDNNKIIRLGNIKNIVFYYCPVFTDLTKFHVDVGVKFGRQIVVPNFKTDGLAFTLEFNRKYTKDYRTTDNPLDYSKKKLSEKTTEIMKKPLSDFYDMTVEAKEREIVHKKFSEETTKIIGEPAPGFDMTKLKNKDNSTETFIPLHNLPIEEQQKLKENLKKSSELGIPKPVFTFISSKGTNDVSLHEKLQNEFKKMEEGIRQKGSDFEKADTVTIRSEIPVQCPPSSNISNCDYDTKIRAFENVIKRHNLPNDFIAAIKGFYKKEVNEMDKIKNLSDDAILTYKLNRIHEYAAAFTSNNVYSKQEYDNLETYKKTYIKHHFLYENNVPFILIDSDTVNFNYYGNTVNDVQNIQDKLYYSLRSLVIDLKEIVKNNILFVKKIPIDQYVNTLTPSIKNRNEYIIKCYLLPKNKF